MLITLLIGLVVIAVIYWALTYLPLPPMLQRIGIVVLVIVAVIWLIGVVTGHRILPL
jgi:hypothetical protein